MLWKYMRMTMSTARSGIGLYSVLSVFVLISSTSGYILSSSNTNEPDEIRCPESKGQFSHPKFCDLFINCWDKKPTVSPCGPNQVYNENIKGCDYPDNVDCKGRGLSQSSNGSTQVPPDEENVAVVTLYLHKDFEGASIDMTASSWHCQNLPDWFNDEASSVNTHNTCVIVCEHQNCFGKCERIAPGTKCHGYLGECGMNDRVSSIQGCESCGRRCP